MVRENRGRIGRHSGLDQTCLPLPAVITPFPSSAARGHAGAPAAKRGTHPASSRADQRTDGCGPSVQCPALGSSHRAGAARHAGTAPLSAPAVQIPPGGDTTSAGWKQQQQEPLQGAACGTLGPARPVADSPFVRLTCPPPPRTAGAPLGSSGGPGAARTPRLPSASTCTTAHGLHSGIGAGHVEKGGQE